MATTVKIEHAYTIMNGRIVASESDVLVTASVTGNGEVLIDSIEMMAVVPRRRSIDNYAMDSVTEPMTDNSDPHMVRLAHWVSEILLDDPEFIGKAQVAAAEINAGSTPFRQRVMRQLEQVA